MDEAVVNEQIHEVLEVLKGANLSRTKVSLLEKRLIDNPDDLSARLQLLGFFQRPPITEKFYELLIWLISHKPESAIHEHLSTAQELSEGYRLAKQEWLDQVQRSQENLRILLNFAAFCSLCEPAEAISNLRTALSKSPSSTEASFKLAEAFRNVSLTSEGSHAREAVKQFFETVELYEKNTHNYPYLHQYFDQMLREYAEFAANNSLFDEAKRLDLLLQKRKR